MEITETEKKHKKWIVALSIAIPLAVAMLFGINLRRMGFDVRPLTFLPPIYAGINAVTAVLLVLAVAAVRRGNRALHERLVKVCMACSAAFLLLYVAYHMTSDSTPYGGQGALRYLYFFVLITHIVLSVAVIPFVLVTFVRGIAGAYERHKKLARITYPMWLYVAVTGVLVYWMISPYY